MRQYPLACIRLIGFFFLLYSIMFLIIGALSEPLAMIRTCLSGEGTGRSLGFKRYMVSWILNDSSPGLVGLFLLAFSVPLNRFTCPPEEPSTPFFAVVSVRLAIVFTLCLLVCSFLNRCFSLVETLITYWPRTVRYTLEGVGFLIIVLVVHALPAVALWLGSSWIGRRIAGVPKV